MKLLLAILALIAPVYAVSNSDLALITPPGAAEVVPNINLDANAHEITAAIECEGDEITRIWLFVDGAYTGQVYPKLAAPTAIFLTP